MQRSIACNGRDLGVQDLPDLHDQVLTAGQLTLHKIDVYVEIFVIELVYHFPANEGAEALEVHHEACLRVWMTLYGGYKLEIVAMPVFVGTGAKYLRVLLGCPLRIVELVGGVKMFFTGDVDHYFQKFPANFGNNPEQPAGSSLLIQGNIPIVQEITYQHDAFLVFELHVMLFQKVFNLGTIFAGEGFQEFFLVRRNLHQLAVL